MGFTEWFNKKIGLKENELDDIVEQTAKQLYDELGEKKLDEFLEVDEKKSKKFIDKLFKKYNDESKD